MTRSELALMQSIRLGEGDPHSLTELRDVNLDRTRPVHERMEAYLKAVGNPYLFRVGDMAVKVSFAPQGRTLTDALACALAES